MKRRALIASLLVALVGFTLIVVYMRRFEHEASGGAPVSILVATEDIPLGAKITRELVATRRIPEAYVEERHIRSIDVEKVLGIRLSMAVPAGQSILWTDLVTSSEQRRELAGLLQLGMRAATVRADVTSTFGGLLRPGDRVDVFLSTKDQVSSDELVTFPLLQNLLVLSIGGDMGARSGSAEPAMTRQTNQITLAATVQEVATLTHGGKIGDLSLVLRHPDDIMVHEKLPTTSRSDLVAQKPRVVKGPVFDVPPIPSTPDRLQ